MQGEKKVNLYSCQTPGVADASLVPNTSMNAPTPRTFLTLSKIGNVSRSIDALHAAELKSRHRDYRIRKWNVLADYEGLDAYNASPSQQEAARLIEEANALLEKASKILDSHLKR